jgi:activator of 2-hydroxyglutaryl-CoA dehydratase
MGDLGTARAVSSGPDREEGKVRFYVGVDVGRERHSAVIMSEEQAARGWERSNVFDFSLSLLPAHEGERRVLRQSVPHGET